MTLLLILAALSFTGALVVLAETTMPAARRRHDAIAAVRRFAGLAGRARNPRAPTAAIAAAERIGAHLATERNRERLPERLAAAGLAGRLSVEAFLALRVGLVTLGVLVALCVGAVAQASGAKVVLFACAAGAIGFVLPTYAITRRTRTRRERIDAELPNALDLLAVTVEAGLGLFGAIERLVQTTEGPLADEFALVLTEMRVGDSSERALKRMAKRLQSNEMSSFVRSLIQGEQLGLSLAQTLRNLADDTRRRRRAAAEELASKAPVKMLIPTALFIFPALFAVILGPAVIELKNYL
jgi:tight adherence protein C